MSEPHFEGSVQWLLTMSHNRPYCRKCIDFWRELHGSHFADAVAQEARKRYKKKYPKGKKGIDVT